MPTTFTWRSTDWSKAGSTLNPSSRRMTTSTRSMNISSARKGLPYDSDLAFSNSGGYSPRSEENILCQARPVDLSAGFHAAGLVPGARGQHRIPQPSPRTPGQPKSKAAHLSGSGLDQPRNEPPRSDRAPWQTSLLPLLGGTQAGRIRP